MDKLAVKTSFDFPTLRLFRRGKVRDVFDFGKELLIVSSDRVSAFDTIMDVGIPNKGTLLTSISQFWFDFLGIDHHCISTNVDDFPEEAQRYKEALAGRSMYVKKTSLIPIECVVRGYIIGSGWNDYQQTGVVCGHRLPAGLQLAQKLDTPIFTPASKSFDGHDENITEAQMQDQVGTDITKQLKELSLSLYKKATDYALTKGIIIADTKFEFGLLNDKILLIDEVFTPDSSRFWPKDSYEVGVSPASYDKQLIRDYIAGTNWDESQGVPCLPDHIIQKSFEKYQEIATLLTNNGIK